MEKYCVECGTKLIEKELENEEMIPYCENCKQYRFPMFNVAVSLIVIDERKDKILLIKQYGRDHYILVAGYVTKGECVEDTVRRELKEETGMEVHSMVFNQTQYFAPSNTLMCNFTVFVKDGSTIHVNHEIDSYSWFSKE